MKHILFFIVILALFKILFAVLFFICSPFVFLTLVGLGVVIKAGLFKKFFYRKQPKNGDVVIEIEPIKD